MRVLFRPEARLEVLDARAWYEARSVGLGLEFARSLEAAVSAAIRDPSAHPLIDSDCRRILLRRFPYSLAYQLRPGEFLVLAVFHHCRDPSIISRRVGG